MRKTRESGTIFRTISELLKLPQDVACGDTRVFIIGISRLKIENYKSILIYSDTRIKIQALHQIVVVEGKQLQIRYYDQDEMEIIGLIGNLRFE